MATRLQENATAIRRRRYCHHCGYRFSTLEAYCVPNLVVNKRDGSHEAFAPQKILSALQKTFKKDACSEESIRQLHQQIIKIIHEQEKRPITSQRIGDIVSEQLKQADPMAYIRFVSVYKNLQTPGDLLSAVQSIPQNP
jgi:transcriptional repressor NrdR